MKKVIPVLALLIITIACSNEKIKTLVTGSISNPDIRYVVFYGETKNDTAWLDSLNTFHKELTVEEASYFTFYNGKGSTKIFIRPGDNLHIMVDSGQFDESLAFEGTAAIPNNYLKTMQLVHDELINIKGREIYMMEENIFRAYLDSVETVKMELLSKIPDQYDEFSEFREMEKGRIIYSMAIPKANYPSYHPYYTGKEEFEVSDNYYNFLNQLDINNYSFPKISEYNRFINSYIEYFSDKRMENYPEYKDMPLGYYYNQMATIDSIISNEKIKESLLKNMISGLVNYDDISEADSLLNVFYSRCTDTAFNSKIKKQVKSWEKLAEGMPAPVFSYPDQNGDTVSLDDFRGKYVYIDVWASWCGPCKAETPYFRELVKEFKDNNVVFISVSVDSDIAAWRNMIAREEMNWIQLISENAWNTKITKDYMIKGIPRFILVDRQGNIVTPRAPRPSENIAKLLREQEGI